MIFVASARSVAAPVVRSSIPARIAIMIMTIRSSTSVNPPLRAFKTLVILKRPPCFMLHRFVQTKHSLNHTAPKFHDTSFPRTTPIDFDRNATYGYMNCCIDCTSGMKTEATTKPFYPFRFPLFFWNSISKLTHSPVSFKCTIAS